MVEVKYLDCFEECGSDNAVMTVAERVKELLKLEVDRIEIIFEDEFQLAEFLTLCNLEPKYPFSIIYENSDESKKPNTKYPIKIILRTLAELENFLKICNKRS